MQSSKFRSAQAISSWVREDYRRVHIHIGLYPISNVSQDIYYGIRDKTRIIADQHANLGRTIDSSIVQHLQKLRTEIKAHIKVRDLHPLIAF